MTRGWLTVRRVCSLLLGAACCAACIGPGERTVPASWSPSDPFAPVHMRIYPLTHVERGPSGVARLVAHFEFTDRWYDTTKAAGRLEVFLFRPGPSAGTEERRVRWELDLTDLDRNADWYDPVTRTYRMQLDLPGWADEGPGSEFRLHASFTAPGAGRETLTDDYTLRG